jgi:AraC family transcriptional regulator of adaptative response / DNA-3-methyladenine glycosylase II
MRIIRSMPKPIRMLAPTPAPAPTLASPDSAANDDACYLALKTRDARFDGRFFTAVTSTGIYCRPVCKVRCPKRENCRFFPLAAQAEQAGFRPCLRCRPELAPSGSLQGVWPEGGAAVWSVQDASSILAQQAARLLDAPDAWSDGVTSMTALAERLGVSERHVRRIFEAHWGVSPLQYWQTRRLLTAKQLLTDTQLPVAQVAGLSGFASVRRFNDAFVGHYRLQPTALRKQTGKDRNQGGGKAKPEAYDEALVLRAAYRPPYDVAAMLQFFATRQIEGVEHVDLARQTLTRTLAITPAGSSQPVQGWVQAQFVPDSCNVTLRISASLSPALPTVLARLRAWLDLDADPQAINALLLADFPGTEGLRVPGTLDGFELAVRAVLGQQITVAAARTLGTRLVERYGEPLSTPREAWVAQRSAQVKEEPAKRAGDTEQSAVLPTLLAQVNRLFPTAATLAKADPDVLGQLGIVKQRQKAIQAIAHAVVLGQLSLHPGADVPATMAALQALPGIGPWTAHYIALRALRWPDAFPAGDVALHKALGVQDQPHPAQAAEAASQRWRPWRSYAVLRAWSRLNPASA